MTVATGMRMKVLFFLPDRFTYYDYLFAVGSIRVIAVLLSVYKC